MAEEETFKYTADFSQISAEIDKINDKISKLSASLDRTSKKFGDQSPQATMVKTALDRVSAELDRKIAELEKLQQQSIKSGEGGGTGKGDKARSSADEDLERRYKRESLKYYREYQQRRRHEEAQGKEFQDLFKGLAGKGGIFNPQAISSFINLITGNVGKGGGLGGAAIGGAMLGSKVTQTSKVAGATAAEVEGAEAATAGTTEAMAIGTAANLLKRPGIITAIASAAVAADFVIASRGAARGKFAAGIGATVGGVSAAQLGYERYLDDPNSVMRGMMEARYDITSPQYRALTLLGINPHGKKPEDLLGQSASAISKQLKGFGKVDEDTLLTLAHVTGMGNLGFSDEDLIRLYHGSSKDIADVAKKAKADRSKYDLDPNQVKALQDNVQWMKEWATEGETLVEKGVAVGTQFTELASKSMPDLIKKLDDLVKEYDIFSPLLNTVNKEFESLGKSLHDWVKKWLDPDAPSPDAQPTAFEVGGGGGFRIPGGGGGPGRRPSGQRGGASEASAEAIGPIDLGDPEAKVGSYADAMKVLMKAGLTKNEAAGMAGNATAESLLGTMMHGKVLGVGTGDSGSASGMFQWHSDRWNRQVAWAKSQGLDPAKPSTQLKMGAHEYITEWRKRLGARINAAQTPEEIERAINPFEGNASGAGRPSAVGGVRRGLQEAPTGPVSMNNMKHFQGNDRSYAINIHNPAGASYQVSGGMLGASYGNYGNA